VHVRDRSQLVCVVESIGTDNDVWQGNGGASPGGVIAKAEYVSALRYLCEAIVTGKSGVDDRLSGYGHRLAATGGIVGIFGRCPKGG
jgi:hypothetical protein